MDAYILSHCEPAHHISGTCRMGAVDDPLSVCDEEGSVIGVAALRVVDASLMPVRCHWFYPKNVYPASDFSGLHVTGTKRSCV
jgi:hypothetical protein